jgi:predicted dehydrogenase
VQTHAISMLGTGLIGDFYTMTLHGQRGRDRVRVVYSRGESRGRAFVDLWAIPEFTTDMQAAIRHPETDVVVVALPNHLHDEAVNAVAAAGKAVLCTKPLGRTADEALRMLEAVGQPRSMIAPPPVSRLSQNQAKCGPEVPTFPASYLRRYPNLRVFADEAAATLLV